MQKIQLYVNSTNVKAKKASERIRKELEQIGYDVVDNNADIVIGFGGDGTLLHFLRSVNYKTKAKYIGINCGTLGFLQDFEVKDIKDFVQNIPFYVSHKLKFVVACVEVNGEKYEYKALNEIMMQDAENKSFRTTMRIQDEFVQNYVGTGLIFSTPTGSTALNLSAGGSIIHPSLESIQITPREAISNSKMHCLSKSMCLPSNFQITLTPGRDKKIAIYSDGEEVYKGSYDNITISYSNEGILKLANTKDGFVKTIREKLI